VKGVAETVWHGALRKKTPNYDTMKTLCYLPCNDIYPATTAAGCNHGLGIMPDERTYTITELAREFALTPRAIRHYEHEGLLAPGRLGRNRVFTRADRTRLKLVLRGKRLGFSLQETRELFDLYDAARDERPQLVKLLEFLRPKRDALEQQRDDIDAILREMDELERRAQAVLSD
jgi:DNA-binding transcriptional MerR regulator